MTIGKLTSTIDPDLKNRAIGAYLGLAVGDALGASVEFLTPREIKQKYGVHQEIIGGGWLHLKPGQVTDDTEMSLALGQSIIEQQGVNAEKIADAFKRFTTDDDISVILISQEVHTVPALMGICMFLLQIVVHL